MPALSASDVLQLWETGLTRRPLDRAVLMLWAAREADDPAMLPLGARDRALLELRRAQFGQALDVVTECHACGAKLEMTLDIGALIGAIRPPDDVQIEAGGQQIRLRALTSADLAVAAQAPDGDLAHLIRTRLVGEVGESLWPRIDAAIEAQSAEAELRLSLTCSECGEEWSESMDVARHVWTEFDALARRLLSDVAELARAFGWGEAQTLALSPQRRQAYLDIARAGV